FAELLDTANQHQGQSVHLSDDASADGGRPLAVHYESFDVRFGEFAVLLEGCDVEGGLGLLGRPLSDGFGIVKIDEMLQGLDLVAIGAAIPGLLESRG